MVLRKSCRIWRKYRPRSVLLESREVPDHVLLFESDVIASLSELFDQLVSRIQPSLMIDLVSRMALKLDMILALT